MPRSARGAEEVLLYAEHFAPWCERARWVLDHHSIAYRYHEHVPFLGEWALRRATRCYSYRVSVPLLVVGDERIADSYRIAQKAEELGAGPPLFPDNARAAMWRWNAVSETVMRAGRAMLLARLSQMPDALAEQVPWHLPVQWRPFLLPVARAGVRFVARKYDTAALLPTAEATMSLALDELRAALFQDAYLLRSGFSFADVAMAAALQFVEPVSGHYIRLGPASRRAWTAPHFQGCYPDLLAWRDEVYALHRGPPQRDLSGGAASSG